MDPLTISTVASLGKGLIERIWPDPKEQAIELRKLREIEQRGDLAELEAHLAQIQGQLSINLQEAAHPSLFVAGWRPFIGWTGGGAMAYQFLMYPMLIWLWAALQAKGAISTDLAPPPVMETGALFAIITGMLGVGFQRSYDKTKGTDTKSPGKS